MSRWLPWLLLLVTGAAYSQGQPTQEVTPGRIDPDGFKNPVQYLHFNPGLDQKAFERANLKSLQIYDPWEPFNRRMYHLNYRLDQWVLLPVVGGYKKMTPHFVRSGVSNFFANLGDVGNLFNNLLQFKFKRSADTTARLLFNTGFGVFGLWDPATRMGLPKRSEDFGQTLAVWGVGPGPYLVLPLLGPSNLRDAGGKVADYGAEHGINFLDVPQTADDHWEISLLRAVDLRYRTPLEYGQLNSPFEYERVRYVFSKARDLQIAD